MAMVTHRQDIAKNLPTTTHPFSNKRPYTHIQSKGRKGREREKRETDNSCQTDTRQMERQKGRQKRKLMGRFWRKKNMTDLPL